MLKVSKYLAIIAIFLINFFYGGIPYVYAVDTPNFPACTNPSGTIRVDYPSGNHGIVGSTSEFSGRDTVYQLTEDTLSQCFCSTNGEGIQTNWWQVSSLTDEQIDILKKDGWDFVPNGALWGLEETPYLAKSSDYACGGSNSSNSSSSASSQASILGDILGLASTGNNALFYSLGIFGLTSLIMGLILKKNADG